MQRVYLRRAIGHQPDTGRKIVACVDDTDLVLRLRVQTAVAPICSGASLSDSACVHQEKRAPFRPIVKSHERGLQKGRVLGKALAANQVRLIRRIAQVIIESSRAGIGPIHDLSDPFEPFAFAIQLA